MRTQLARAVLAVALAGALVAVARAQAPDPEAVKRGEYVFNAGGCVGCHTDVKNNGPRLAGGRELKTPFGIFYGPNITPDPQTGIGRWTEADFMRAMREGVRPDGAYYFPVFPYPSYTGIADADLKDLFAYLKAQPPVSRPSRPHDVGFPFNLRFLLAGWRWFNFSPGPFRPDPARSATLNRGAYLVDALGHCGECHTPRNRIGASQRTMYLGGTLNGPEGGKVPNITPDPETGLKYSAGELTELLTSGMMPDGDFVGGGMGEVVKEGTGKLSREDIAAMVAYLRSVPPVRNRIRGAP